MISDGLKTGKKLIEKNDEKFFSKNFFLDEKLGKNVIF